MIYNIKCYQKDIPLPSEEDKTKRHTFAIGRRQKEIVFFKGKIE